MNLKSFKIFVAAKDNRQKNIYLILKNHGYDVYYGNPFNTLNANYDIYILEVPCKDLNYINFFNQTKNKPIIFTGYLDEKIKNYFNNTNFKYIDYKNIEKFIVLNSLATAEGAIALAILNSNKLLSNSNCLILGDGHCGSSLACVLKRFTSHICICSRRNYTYNKSLYINYEILKNKIHEYDFIFNTVPALVLKKDELINTNSNAVIIDIASFPGGIDYNYVKQNLINAQLYLGIPGKYFSYDIANIICEYIINYIEHK